MNGPAGQSGRTIADNQKASRASSQWDPAWLAMCLSTPRFYSGLTSTSTAPIFGWPIVKREVSPGCRRLKWAVMGHPTAPWMGKGRVGSLPGPGESLPFRPLRLPSTPPDTAFPAALNSIIRFPAAISTIASDVAGFEPPRVRRPCTLSNPAILPQFCPCTYWLNRTTCASARSMRRAWVGVSSVSYPDLLRNIEKHTS